MTLIEIFTQDPNAVPELKILDPKTQTPTFLKVFFWAPPSVLAEKAMIIVVSYDDRKTWGPCSLSLEQFISDKWEPGV